MTDERKPYGGLTEAEVNDIAERAAQKALDHGGKQIAEQAAQMAIEHMAAQFGMGVLKKLAWLICTAILGLAAWLAGNGIIKP